MTGRRVLYIPVETKARELLGKSFLAARAAERGWIAILGEGSEVREYIRDHPPGVFIEISIPEKKLSRLQSIREAGHRIANLCEEGMVYPDGRDYCDRKVGETAFSLIDLFLAAGRRHADDVSSCRREHLDKIAITGNPRFDTLGPELRCVYQQEADAIRSRFGRFILVNTNFGRANPHASVKGDRIAKMKRRGMIKSEELADFFRRLRDHKARQMRGLQDFLSELANTRVVDRIVVRPHPVENHDVWREWAPPGVEVRYEGSAIEWMLASEAVLHPGCTTGLEGLMLDRPVFSYVPEPDSEFLNPSDMVSEWVVDVKEFARQLEGVHTDRGTELRDRLAPQREKLGFFVANIRPPFAADRILDEFQQLDLPAVSDKQAGVAAGVFSRLRKHLRLQKGRARSGRQLQKFGPIEDGEIDLAISQWVAAGILQGAPRIGRLGERLWVIH